jgi:hypothetical protein
VANRKFRYGRGSSRRSASSPQGVTAVAVRKTVRLTFQGGRRDEAFGKFCASLAAFGIPFDIGGRRTVFLDTDTRSTLSGEPYNLLTDCLNDGTAQESTIVVTGNRIVRTHDEALRIAQSYIQSR